MNDQFSESVADVQSKLRSAKAFCLDRLLPKPEVLTICDEIGHEFRDRIHNPMIVVWMFITQVLSKDHSCQQAGHAFQCVACRPRTLKVSGVTTAYCKARCRLSEELFE